MPKSFQKKKKCRRCGIIGNSWNKYKLIWANGSYEYKKENSIKDTFIICWDCSDKMLLWVSDGNT